MKTKQETFESHLRAFSYRYDERTVFDDFLTMSVCALSQNPDTGKSYDEELYLETISNYKNDELRFRFPKMFASLVLEMEERTGSSMGNDVLGEFYEQNLYRKGTSQYFTPYPVCHFMASAICEEHKEIGSKRPLRILDPCCGSGRMLLAAKTISGPYHEFYGIDIDATCVKMAAINFFLNGMFSSEVLCADALVPEDFRVSYVISFAPLGIFRIAEKEKSPLWHLLKASFSKEAKQKTGQPLGVETLEMKSHVSPDGTQLSFF